MSDRPPAPPAGWYLDEALSSKERYWDGRAWTEQTREASAAHAAPPGSPPPNDPNPAEAEPPATPHAQPGTAAKQPIPSEGPSVQAQAVALWRHLGNAQKIALLAVPVVLLVVVLATAGGDGGGGSSGNEALDDAGVQVDALGTWSYSVTCGQIRDHPDIIRPTAVELSEELNSPLGKDAAIDAIADALPLACAGVSPDYSPGQDAFAMAENEVGG